MEQKWKDWVAIVAIVAGLIGILGSGLSLYKTWILNEVKFVELDRRLDGIEKRIGKIDRRLEFVTAYMVKQKWIKPEDILRYNAEPIP